MGDSQATRTEFTNCAMNGTVLGFAEVGTFVGWVDDPNNFQLGESNGDNGNTVGENADVKYIFSLSTRLGTGLNAIAEKGEYIEITKGKNLTWEAVEGAAYYRVVFGGTLFHLLVTETENEYNLHFVGGYISPMEVSGQLKEPKYEGTIYEKFATTGVLNAESKLNEVDKLEGKNQNDINDFNSIIKRQTKDYSVAEDGKTGTVTIDGKSYPCLVISSEELSTATSILVAKNYTLKTYVFAYDSNGVIIAGGSLGETQK